MATIRQELFHLRHRIRDRLFRNNQPLAVNLRHARYWEQCRSQWRPYTPPSPEDGEFARQFATQGFLELPPPESLPFSTDALRSKIDRIFADDAGRLKIGDGIWRLFDGLEKVPEIVSFIDPPLERILEAHFGSHFKIFGVHFYRTEPTPAKPQSSFLWHIDNCPSTEMKVMVYLDDVVEDTGALKIKDKSITDQLRKKGFLDRRKVSAIQSELDNRLTTHVLAGKVGTRILFENGKALHKATSPLRDHRDVVTFVIYPSLIHWREQFGRTKASLSTNAGALVDPAMDRPQHIGYRY